MDLQELVRERDRLVANRERIIGSLGSPDDASTDERAGLQTALARASQDIDRINSQIASVGAPFKLVDHRAGAR